MNAARNYVLREAEKMAKEHVSIGKDTIRIDWKGRCVMHGSSTIIIQEKNVLKGIFQGDFVELTLP